MFYEFLKLQYQTGRLTKEQLLAYVPTFISQQQVQEITGDKADD